MQSSHAYTFAPLLSPLQVFAGLNQHTGELMAVKVLEVVTKHGSCTPEMFEQLKELKQVGGWCIEYGMHIKASNLLYMQPGSLLHFCTTVVK